MYAGCYTLDLYCDKYDPTVLGCNGHTFNEFPHQFTHELGSRCRQSAKLAGWRVNYKTGAALCPKCNKHDDTGTRKC